MYEAPNDAIRVDGMLREWNRKKFSELGEGDDAAIRYALAYDDANLWVAAKVRDERLVRLGDAGKIQDAVVLTLAHSRRGRFSSLDIWLYPGVPGRSSALVAVGPSGRAIVPVSRDGRRGANIVEALEPNRAGYRLEARVSLDALERRAPGVKKALAARRARGAIRLVDVDREARPAVDAELASAPVDLHHLAALPRIRRIGNDAWLLRQFLRRVEASKADIDHDLHGNVCGDRQAERVVVVDGFVVVLGPGYRNGEVYDFSKVAADPVRAYQAQLQDVTGDGRRELLLGYIERVSSRKRRVWRVVAFDCERVRVQFAAETGREIDGRWIKAPVMVRTGNAAGSRRGLPTIEIQAPSPDDGQLGSQTDSSSNRAPLPPRLLPMLSPRGAATSRTYRWDGQRFGLLEEEKRPARRRARGTARPSDGSRNVEVQRTAPPAISVASEDRPSRVRELLALARRELGVEAGVRARFRKRVNVAEDPRHEHVLVLGQHVVVVGDGFLGGSRYFQFIPPVTAPEGILHLTTADLSGDGRDEILVRVSRDVGPFFREMLFVYRFSRAGFARVFGAEVGRVQGKKFVRNQVRLPNRGSRRILIIRAGRARGFGSNHWPWPDPPAGEFAPLRLPWRDAPREYLWKNNALVASGR